MSDLPAMRQPAIPCLGESRVVQFRGNLRLFFFFNLLVCWVCWICWVSRDRARAGIGTIAYRTVTAPFQAMSPYP